MMIARTPRSRRGAAYLIALLAGSIVTVTGLAALSISTSKARTATLADQATRARTLARSGLDHALCAVGAHLSGGGTRSDIFGSASPSITMDGGTFEWTFARMDGTALGNTDEPIVVRAKSQSGSARYGLHATLVPSGVPLDVLDTGLYAGDSITISTSATVASDKVIGAAGEVSATSATINAPVESVATIAGTTYNGTRSPGAPERRMPDPSLIDHYLAIGERISYSSLPVSGLGRGLQDVLLSPSSNPFGATNEYGIYIIEPGMNSLTISNVRIVGTLIILDASSTRTIIGSGVLMQPAFDWMPSLLVRGDVSFMGTSTGPSESVAGVNMNPSHTPFNFEFDQDTSDTFPGRIEGVSYVSGDAVFAFPRQNIQGTMVVGDDVRVLVGATLQITYDAGVATLPPVGFFEDAGGLALDPLSIAWRVPN